MLTQLEFEKKAADERVRLAEMYDSTLEERAKEQTAELTTAREKESQHRATAAQMRFSVVFSFSVYNYLYHLIFTGSLLEQVLEETRENRLTKIQPENGC